MEVGLVRDNAQKILEALNAVDAAVERGDLLRGSLACDAAMNRIREHQKAINGARRVREPRPQDVRCEVTK